MKLPPVIAHALWWALLLVGVSAIGFLLVSMSGCMQPGAMTLLPAGEATAIVDGLADRVEAAVGKVTDDVTERVGARVDDSGNDTLMASIGSSVALLAAYMIRKWTIKAKT